LAKKGKHQLKKWVVICLSVAVLFLGVGLIYNAYQKHLDQVYFKELSLGKYRLGLEAVEINYGKQIEKEAIKRNLDPNFLKALCMLECSGRRKVPSRFERHVYKRLLEVKQIKGSVYEGIGHAQIKMLSKAGIKNLSSSWGPFQLMGLKSIGLNCKVGDLRNEKAIEKAVEWIEGAYGNYIRKEKFKDAFHIHNTGRTYPKFGPPQTYNAQYVNMGLHFMRYFNHLSLINCR